MSTGIPTGPTDLTIEFTSVPAYGSFLSLKGIVRHVDTEKLRVAVYIRVNGGWWTKPYWDSPATPISPDGSFSVDVTTGGRDEQATDIAAFLIPAEYYPPGLRGDTELPARAAAEGLGPRQRCSLDVTTAGRGGNAQVLCGCHTVVQQRAAGVGKTSPLF